MKQTKLDILKDKLNTINSENFNLYSSYGFNPIQIKELFEYEKFQIMYTIRAKYITKDMTVAQIREVMKGIYSEYMIHMDVSVYAHKKYHHNLMRIVRLLLEWDFDTILLKRLLDMGEFTHKEFFIFALISQVDYQDIECNLRFVKKCKDQVLELYDAYRPMFNTRKKYSLSKIMKSFDHDLYLAKIVYLASHNNESI